MRGAFHPPSPPDRGYRALWRDRRGNVVVEAAFTLPIVIALLLGILVYGTWFMTAHSLQQAANEAARASVAGLTTTERRTLAESSVNASRASFPSAGAQSISFNDGESGGYFTVTLHYNLANSPLFAAFPFVLPASDLQRSALVKISQP